MLTKRRRKNKRKSVPLFASHTLWAMDLVWLSPHRRFMSGLGRSAFVATGQNMVQWNMAGALINVAALILRGAVVK